MPKLTLYKSRFWLAHRNGRVAAESGCDREGTNPYRKGSPSWSAFRESFDARTALASGQEEG